MGGALPSSPLSEIPQFNNNSGVESFWEYWLHVGEHVHRLAAKTTILNASIENMDYEIAMVGLMITDNNPSDLLQQRTVARQGHVSMDASLSNIPIYLFLDINMASIIRSQAHR